MKHRRHIPLKGGRLTWISPNDPDQDQIDIFQKMIDAVNESRQLEVDYEPTVHAENSRKVE